MKALKRLLISIVILFVGLYVWGMIYSREVPLVQRTILADSNRIHDDLYFLTDSCRFRNYQHPSQLNKARDYIRQQLSAVCDSVSLQKFEAIEMEFSNVIASFGPPDAERIIVGAHYDACGDQPGADDNASGVCGLLELARLLQKADLKCRVDLVAYANEEPPFFKSTNMGSYVHAKSLHDANIKVKGMICLEMIGVFFDEPHTQQYPAFFLEWFYGNKGNFITVVQPFGNGAFGAEVRKRMKQNQVIPTKSFTAPQWMAGIDLSDQRNYWQFDYSAVMISNTAFYRNQYYHRSGDTPEKINTAKIGLVVDELLHTIENIGQ